MPAPNNNSNPLIDFKKKTQTEEQKLPSNIRKHIENTNKQKGKVKLKKRGNKFQRERKIPTYNQYK